MADASKEKLMSTGSSRVVDHIDVQRDREVMVVTIDRPEKLNALTGEMLRGLAQIIQWVARDDSARGVVLTGAGRAFCAGEDLGTVADQVDRDGWRAHVELFQDVTRTILDVPGPVIAALNGIAVGGGAELTLCCDARVAGPEAELLLPERGLGLTISNASSFLLPRLVGARAMSVVMDGRRWDAPGLHELGLVDRIVPRGEDLVGSCVEQIVDWTEAPSSARAMLELLRPPRAEVEAAMRRETDAAVAEWERGAHVAGVNEFLTRTGRTD